MAKPSARERFEARIAEILEKHPPIPGTLQFATLAARKRSGEKWAVAVEQGCYYVGISAPNGKGYSEMTRITPCPSEAAAIAHLDAQ